MLRERLRERRAAMLVSGGVWIGAGSISGEKSTFWLCRVIFISGGPVGSLPADSLILIIILK